MAGGTLTTIPEHSKEKQVQPIVKNTIRGVTLAALCIGGLIAYLHVDRPITQTEAIATKDQRTDLATAQVAPTEPSNQIDPQVQEQLNSKR
jgi:hypothetical protein